jgi:hypothetical protein
MIRAASTAPRRILATSLRRHKHLYAPLIRPCSHLVFTREVCLRNYAYPIQRRDSYTTMSSATSFYDFKPVDSTSSSRLCNHHILTAEPTERGSPYPLSNLQNKVVLVVNTASKCGFTPQFAGLEKLYKELKAAHPNDFEIIGFPCNQFGGQDPGCEFSTSPPSPSSSSSSSS